MEEVEEEEEEVKNDYENDDAGRYGWQSEVGMIVMLLGWAGWVVERAHGMWLLVPDYIVDKGTIKHHKTDEKSTHFAAHIPPSIFSLKKVIPLQLEPIQLRVGMIKNPNVDGETCTIVLSFCFGLVPTQKHYLLLEL